MFCGLAVRMTSAQLHRAERRLHLAQGARWLRHRLTRYAIAVAATSLALVLQLILWPYIPPSPQLLFYPAILLVASIGGFRPGMLAVFLSSLAIAYWFLPPGTAFSIAASEDALDLAIFAAMGVTAVALTARARTAIEKARAAWAEAETARKRLDEALRAREEMLAVVSHDLRSPITSIELSCTQLQRLSASGDGQVRISADRIQRAARRMQVLVRNLLDVATLEAGALRVRPQRILLRGLLEDAVKLFEPLDEQKSIHLGTEVTGPETIVCDGERILQTLENLVGNSIKFVPRGGRIDLAVRTESNEIIFDVRDSGPGIPGPQLARIFERYWQGETSAGSGLGLYIARGIIEAHGGRIWAKGDGGTTISFALPVRADDVPVSEPGLKSGERARETAP